MSRVTELAEKYGITSNRNSKLREGLREGISLRDHFACAAMQGMTDSQPKFYSIIDIDSVAKLAYQQADEMLMARLPK